MHMSQRALANKCKVTPNRRKLKIFDLCKFPNTTWTSRDQNSWDGLQTIKSQPKLLMLKKAKLYTVACYLVIWF